LGGRRFTSVGQTVGTGTIFGAGGVGSIVEDWVGSKEDCVECSLEGQYAALNPAEELETYLLVPDKGKVDDSWVALCGADTVFDNSPVKFRDNEDLRANERRTSTERVKEKPPWRRNI
jgi:hypothetical protein